MERYYCTKPHMNGQKGMYHYPDEVIYKKHLPNNMSKIHREAYEEKSDKIDELKHLYRHYAGIGEWDRVVAIGVELQEMDMAELEIELSNELTAEQIKNYKDWDKRENGDTDTQMDDDA